MARRNGFNRPWDEPTYRKDTSLAQLRRAIRAQQNRVANTTGEERDHHQKALQKLQQDWRKIIGGPKI